jgi:hypothetical protein
VRWTCTRVATGEIKIVFKTAVESVKEKKLENVIIDGRIIL